MVQLIIQEMLTIFLLVASILSVSRGAAIDDYVKTDDGYFSWKEIPEWQINGTLLGMSDNP
jgi:hypothetical protein